MKLGIRKRRINFSFVNTHYINLTFRNTSPRWFIVLPKLLMFRFSIIRFFGNSLLKLIKLDTSDSRLFIFLSPVTLPLRRSYSLSVFAKNTLWSIKPELLSVFHFGFLVACETLIASSTLPWEFQWSLLLPNCFSFISSLLLTCNFEFLSSWFIFYSRYWLEGCLCA